MSASGVMMPNAVPTRTPESLGRYKEDRSTPKGDLDTISAEEYNRAMDEIIETAKLTLQLRLTGSLGTLQAAYNNGGGAPTRILLDTVRQGVEIADLPAGLGSYLFRVVGRDTTELLRLADGDWAIGTRGASATGLRSVSNTSVSLVGTGGRDFTPSEDGKGDLGASGLAWGQALALAHGSRLTTVAYNSGGVTYDASKGSVFYTQLTGGMADFTITNGIEHQLIAVMLGQDVTGNRQLTSTLPVNHHLAGNRPTTGLSIVGGSLDIFYFMCSHQLGSPHYYEVGRWQQDNPRTTYYGDHDVASAPSTVTLAYPTAPAQNKFYGVAITPYTINLTHTGARTGDNIRLDFPAAGVTTDAVNTLTIQDNGSPSVVYNQSKTLKGCIFATYAGGAWVLNSCTTYV